MEARRRPGIDSWRSRAGARYDMRARRREPLLRSGERFASRATAYERLLEANAATIVQAARRLRGKGVPFSDLVQEGALALFTAMEQADISGEFEFGERVARIVEERLADLVGAARDGVATSGGLLERAMAPDPQALRLEAERIEKAHTLLSLLGHDEERVLRLRFGIDSNEQPTLEATAQSLGMKRGRVSALESKALLLLRRAVHRMRWTFPR
jgi:RNA polymerase sigma factor (sigma-70 family)